MVYKDAVERTEGGIFLAPETQAKVSVGIVVAVGPGWWYDGVFVKPEVEPGDRVLFGTFDGSDVMVDGDVTKFTMLSWPNIQAVVR